MWFFRFCPNLSSQVKQAQSQMEKVVSLSRGVNPVMGVRVDWNSEEKKGLLLVKGGDEGTNFFSYVGKVLQEDAYQQAMDEFKNALKMRGNWTVEGWVELLRRRTATSGPGGMGKRSAGRAGERSYCRSAGWRSFSSRTRCRTCSRNF